MKIQLSPGLHYLQILVFFGHACYYMGHDIQIDKINQANKPLELMFQGMAKIDYWQY